MISKIFFKIESMLFSVFFGTIDIFPRDLRFFEGGRQIFVFFLFANMSFYFEGLRFSIVKFDGTVDVECMLFFNDSDAGVPPTLDSVQERSETTTNEKLNPCLLSFFKLAKNSIHAF